MPTLKDKLAFVTGGSEGIGLAVAKDLAREGARVIIIARNQMKLNQAREEILKFAGGQAFVEVASIDVADDSQVKTKLEALVDKMGVPDFLINCAGFAHPGYINELETSVYRQMMDVNYFGIVNTCRVLVPHFIRAGKKAQIINTSSLAGFMGLFGYTGYCASKYAVVGFSQALLAELKPYGIQVSVLCPPNTKTPGLDKENQIKPPEVLKMEEKAKVVTAEEVSATLVKSLGKKKFWIIPTFDGSLALYLSRLAPKILDQFIKRPPLNS